MQRVGTDKKRSKGYVIFSTALFMIFISPIIGLGFDVGLLYLIKTRLSAAADSAALAAARGLNNGATPAVQKTNAIDTAKKFFRANFPDRYMLSNANTDPNNPLVEVDDYSVPRRRTVTVTVEVSAPLYFLRVLSHDAGKVRAIGQAVRTDVNMIIVLDRSSSMNTGSPTRCAIMRPAAANFVGQFAEGRDQLGLIVFGGHYVRLFAPTFNFKSTSDFAGAINTIVCGSNTGTAQALSIAYQDLQTAYNTNAGPLNIIMLFTDGLPNGISGDYDSVVNMGGSCGCKTPADPGTCQKIGWMSQTSGFAPTGNTNGLFTNIGISAANANNTLLTTSPQTDGCAFRGGSGNIRNDITQMVGTDMYGSATTGYVAVDLTAAKSAPQQLGYASKNAADNAGTAIRSDATLKPRIYAIGLEGISATEDPDPVMIMRLTNVKASPIYNSSQPEGFFTMTTNGDLPDAFEKVATEILRLSW